MTVKLTPLIALLALGACANSAEPDAPATASPVAAAPVAAAPPAVAAPTAAAPPATAVASAGAETLQRVCSGCHAPELVADKRLDRAGWDEVVQTMIGRGAQASDAEAKAIVDYLARTYPAAG